jgi:hypothetical protein
MSSFRGRLGTLLAAIPLVLGLGVTAAAVPAAPAAAATITQIGDPQGYYLNLWGGNFDVKSYGSATFNNWITVQWVNHTQFELRDNVHGGCIGDLNGSATDPRAGGGNSCPSSGQAAWGSVFEPKVSGNGNSCGSWRLYYSPHWREFISFANGNGNQVVLNGGGVCLKQFS